MMDKKMSRRYEIIYDDGYGYSIFRCYAESKTDAIKQFTEAIGSRYKVTEVEINKY